MKRRHADVDAIREYKKVMRSSHGVRAWIATLDADSRGMVDAIVAMFGDAISEPIRGSEKGTVEFNFRPGAVISGLRWRDLGPFKRNIRIQTTGMVVYLVTTQTLKTLEEASLLRHTERLNNHFKVDVDSASPGQRLKMTMFATQLVVHLNTAKTTPFVRTEDQFGIRTSLTEPFLLSELLALYRSLASQNMILTTAMKPEAVDVVVESVPISR